MKNYAGFWQRVAAFTLDYIIILGYLLGIALLSLLVNLFLSVNQWLFADRVRAQFVAFLLVTFPLHSISQYPNHHQGRQRGGKDG